MGIRTCALVPVVNAVTETIPVGPTRDHILALLARADAAYQESYATKDPATVALLFARYKALSAEVDGEILAYRATLE